MGNVGYDVLIEIAKDISTLAAAGGLIWGAVAFIRKIKEEREARRAADVERWREVAAYEAFNRASSEEVEGPPHIHFEVLLSHMRSSTWEEKGIDFRKDELTEQEVYRLLMSMVEKGLIEQLGDQNFLLCVNAQNLELRGYSSPIREPYPQIIEFVRQNSGELTEAELRLRMDMTPLKCREHLLRLIRSGFLEFDEKGRLHLVHDEDWAARQRAKSSGNAKGDVL